ncbi:MAG: ABC transporter ATP-binding protein [Spirochaetes bacterium]|nr:ABC transporter ATP-binding protein [Spirochaetota bacterium]
MDIGEYPIVSITGKTGSGKTSLLSIMSGLLKPDSGKVFFKNKNIYSWTDYKRSAYRNRKIGFVYQSFNLLPDFTVYQNIVYPAVLNPFAVNVKKHADYLIEYLNISNIKNNYPSEISGGEKQRAAIARAIINKPEIILADEPTGNLDNAAVKSIFRLFREIQIQYNVVFIIATHDLNIIRKSDIHYAIKDSGIIRKSK